MKCPKCQADNPENKKFCRDCGARLVGACPKCGSECLPSDTFCGECGGSLGQAKPVHPVDYSKPQTYTPKFLADKILTSRQSIEGERKLVTVLFADVANYTAMSEKLDPEEVHQIMDGCFKILMDEVHRYEGTVDKFTGDGMMALFGAPVAHEDHAQRACYAALGMQRAVKEYGEKVKKDCGFDFKMRVGLNSGPVIVGAVGSDLRMDYTAVGDTVNLASRMQTMAQPGAVLVSRDVHKMTRDFFKFKPLGKLAVKGKEEAVEAYEVLEATQVATRIEAAVIRGLTRFVGRDKEMATLKEAYDKAKSGSGQIVGLVGEAGVGKSRLLLELRRALPEGECTILEGRCLHYGGSMPYLPFLDILRSYFDIEEGDREYVIKKKMAEKASKLDEKLKEALPAIEDILSLKVEDEAYLKLDAPLKRVKIFEAIRDVLIRESQNRPLVLAVEDLHWIDKTSEEFLGYLIGFLANAKIMLLLLYRPEYTHQWASKSYYRQIGVDQLSVTSSAELVQSILEEGEVAPELRQLILTTAAGNPLFMEEFTRSLLENGSIQRKDHQYVLTRKASEIPVPDTIQAIIAARMDRLEDNLKRTMQVASVIGRDFAYRILQTITGTKEELKSHLVNLQGLEFIYEKSLIPELEYIFKHALIQEVAYNSLLIKRRKEIHERIGKAIEELYPERLEEFYEMLAHHYSKAENAEKAYYYLKLAGDKATKNYAKWEALAFYQGAIDLLGRQPNTEDNKRKGIAIRLLMSTPMRYLTFPEGSLPVLEEGERLSREMGDDKSLAQFLSLLSFHFACKGDSRKHLQYAEDCFVESEKVRDVDQMAPIGLQVCTNYSALGEYCKIAEVAPRVIALIESTGRQLDPFVWGFNVYAASHSTYGHALACLGDFEKGEALCEKGLRFAEEIKDLYCAGYAETIYAALYTVKGDGTRAIAHATKAIALSEETRFVTILGLAWQFSGWGHLLLGDIGAAREHVERGHSHDCEVGYYFAPYLYFSVMSEICFRSGDWGGARQYADDGLQRAKAASSRLGEARLISHLGRALAKLDPSQNVKVEGLILKSINMLEELRLKPHQAQGYLNLGELYADNRQEDKALKTLCIAKRMFREMGMDCYLARTEKALEKLKG